MFKELATNVWAKQMLSGVGTKQKSLSDRDRGWFFGGLCRLASAMNSSNSIISMRMLLDPIVNAATNQNLNNIENESIRNFVADTFAKALSTFRPLEGPPVLVSVVDG
jgi:hypothetical protein